MSRIANRQSPVFSERKHISQTTPQFHVERILHQRQSRDSNRSSTNATSTRSKFCVYRGRCDHQQTLVLSFRWKLHKQKCHFELNIVSFFAEEGDCRKDRVKHVEVSMFYSAFPICIAKPKRKLSARIARLTLASDSATTIAQFRACKESLNHLSWASWAFGLGRQNVWRESRERLSFRDGPTSSSPKNSQSLASLWQTSICNEIRIR